MKFEEKFPSLKGLVLESVTRTEIAGEVIDEQDNSRILKAHVQEHCLDKQKVKYAIMKWSSGMTMDHAEKCDCVGCHLWKELGL